MGSYGSWIFDEPLELSMKLLYKAVDEKLEDRMWLYYCVTLPYQDKKNRQSFNDLMKSVRRPKTGSSKQKMTEEEFNHYADIADLALRSKK